MTLALFLALSGCLPQAQAPGAELHWDARRTLAYPQSARVEKVYPFGNTTTPASVSYASAGFADLDGDGVQDAWFLAGPGPVQGQLSVQQSKNSAPGRYRDFSYGPVSTLTGYGWVAGTTLRSTTFGTRERVLLVDPLSNQLTSVMFQRSSQSNFTLGTLLATGSWPVPYGCYEIAARDLDGDGHDDVAVLAHVAGGTEVRKIKTGVSFSTLTPVYEVVGSVPVPLERLRLIDLDGDGRDDVLAHAPGLGIVGLRDDGARGFVLSWFLPLPYGVVDVQVGDLDRDGRDDIVICTSTVVAALLSRNAGHQVLLGVAPAGSTSFATAVVVDGDGDGHPDVVAFGADGASYVVFGYRTPSGAFDQARVVRPDPAEALEYASTLPVQGQPIALGDADNDGDLDVLAQIGGGKPWILLRSPTKRLAPTAVPVVDLGPLSPGTTLIKQQLGVQLPADFTADLWDQLEIAFYMQDANDKSKYLLRHSQIVPLDGSTTQIDFQIVFEKDPQKIANVQQQYKLWPGGLPYLAGDIVIFVHGKQSESISLGRPPRRFESLILWHKGENDPHKSAQGVGWGATQAPPLPSTDNVALPWG